MENTKKKSNLYRLRQALSFRHMKENLELTGRVIAKNKNIFLLFLIVIAVAEVIMFIRGLMYFDLTKTRRQLYMFSYLLLFVVCSATIPVVALARESSHKSLLNMGVVLHFFSFFIIAWSVLISFLDMSHGGTPLVYLTIIMTTGCIVVLHPTVFLTFMVLSYIALDNACRMTDYSFSHGGDRWNILVFLIMSFLVALRQYGVLRKEDRIRKKLEKLTITDTLTGLENETSYYRLQDEIEAKIASGKVEPFAIVMMDLNNIKATNDQWGHRFGCHLIVTAGKMLPEILPTSRLFHIGGDEFVAIVQGEDYNHLSERLNTLVERMAYSKTTLEDKVMILSLAHGDAYWKKGLRYKDVVQAADDAMYARKAKMKADFGISR